MLRHHFRLSGIVTTIDAVNGAAQLGSFAEAVKQASMADRLIVTKTDLSDESSLRALRARLRALTWQRRSSKRPASLAISIIS